MEALTVRRSAGLRAAPPGPHRRRLPVRVAARHRHAARHAVRPIRRPGGLQRAAPPGPLDAGMHTVFIRRKLGQEKVTYPHPALREVLEPTYGVITYQEQVMRIANVLAGFTPGGSRRAPESGGQEGPGADPQGGGKFRRAGGGAGAPAAAGGRARRPDRDLRPLRLQQVALGGLLGPLLSDRVAQDPLSGRVHGRAAVLGDRQHRQGGPVHQRGPGARASRCCRPTSTSPGFKFTVMGERRIRFGLGAVRNVG